MVLISLRISIFTLATFLLIISSMFYTVGLVKVESEHILRVTKSVILFPTQHSTLLSQNGFIIAPQGLSQGSSILRRLSDDSEDAAESLIFTCFWSRFRDVLEVKYSQPMSTKTCPLPPLTLYHQLMTWKG